ncbi:uncharacterized protein LOC110730319 [Chenopodium quinoa]|uniref:Uncharacterized protein n=1 Tax=Chenopodium quinoa TaxID=63459 RepID=A0A803LUG8_CHEQI|nr:uncharacterized protein LOC110730319 [Chenopodium quinoa]
MKMATSLELTIGIEGAYSTSPTKTTDPRLSYMISISNDESLNDNHHNHGVLQKWMHTVLCYKKHSDDSEDYGLHAKGRIKESLGKALLEHPILAGRLRRSENDNGDLRIVSNDSGIRCIDAQISLSLVHFLELSKEKKNEVEGKLLYWKNVDESNPIFSPLFYIQMTKFKCGGYSIGISCSLLLTDPLYMAKFLNKWAKIHMSMVYESEMSKTLSCIYSSYFKFGSEHEYGTIHDSSNTRRKTSKTMIFNISTEETKHYLRDEICKYFVQHCLEKAENIFGSKLGSPFTLMTKEPNGNTKVEIFTRKANFTSPKNLKYELNSSSWEDLKINDVAFQRGNGPIDASHWISCDALEGMVLVVISEAIKGKSGIHVYVTVPIDQDLQEIECY